MNPLRRALLGLLSVCLPAATPAAPAAFTDYGDFYRSLGGTLFQGPGTALALPCTESPRHCIWVTSMRQALRRYDAPLWTTPGDLPMAPPNGTPDVAFDGQALIVGTQRWPLSQITRRAPPLWQRDTFIRPENVATITAWQHGTSVCLDIRYASSGYADRYTGVVLLHEERLYTLPPLFGTCAGVRKAAHNSFSYPSNRYIGAEQENNPEGLEVEYLLSDGTTRIARYRLRFPEKGNPFAFDASIE